jgi:hypothetical protein
MLSDHHWMIQALHLVDYLVMPPLHSQYLTLTRPSASYALMRVLETSLCRSCLIVCRTTIADVLRGKL